jgi:hypothetical protein
MCILQYTKMYQKHTPAQRTRQNDPPIKQEDSTTIHDRVPQKASSQGPMTLDCHLCKGIYIYGYIHILYTYNPIYLSMLEEEGEEETIVSKLIWIDVVGVLTLVDESVTELSLSTHI